MESMNKNEFRMSKKDHFKVLITMAFQNLVSWKELKQLLEDMTSTLEDSNQVVEFLIEELQSCHFNHTNKGETEVHEMITDEASDTKDPSGDLNDSDEQTAKSSDVKIEANFDESVSQDDEDTLEFVTVDHTTQSKQVCKQCNESFETTEGYKNHMKVHVKINYFVSKSEPQIEGQKKENELFKCESCGKTSKSLIYMKRHKKVHTGKGLHHCQNCEKFFYQISDLEKHERTHTGERPYKCRFCKRTFSQIPNLKSHEKTHKNSTKYNKITLC